MARSEFTKALTDFYGPNAGYALELYDRYREDPQSVDPATRAIFDQWASLDDSNGTGPQTTTIAPVALTPDKTDKIVGAVNYAQAIRSYGHLDARLDPLGTDSVGDPALLPETHNITQQDLALLPASLVGGPIAEKAANALEATQLLREVYSSSIGYDYDHIRVPEERAWLREAAESGMFRPPASPIDERTLLDRLTQIEAFESFLHRVFPGKFRFSIEGVDMLIPIMDQVIDTSDDAGISNVLIGMAHRGRLNVLAHVLNKPYAQILAEFKDPVQPRKFRSDLGWTGDVKYHSGARRAIRNGEPVEMIVTIAPNPSHLEVVNPVVEGMARAAGTRVDKRGPSAFDPSVTLPILIHGDAAFPGQGIVAETLNLSGLPGYWTGGTIHIIANNQLGFTTVYTDSRSTLYASDMAKGFKIPVVHVNADDPAACIEVARLAYAYRAKFQKDFMIDLIGYRRYGHNEVDEPGFTQPLMYQIIQKHPTVRQLWANTLQQRGQIAKGDAEALLDKHMQTLQQALESLNLEIDLVEPLPTPPPPGAARRVRTAVNARRLKELNEALLVVPASFNAHSKLERAMKKRAEVLTKPDEPSIDWATAEELAFATILEDGIAIRLTGQDVGRGTFSQRHAVRYDVENGRAFIPLQTIPQAKAAFEIHDSPLSENAALGFEYGYNVQEPGRLVLWEAQYGDFNNGAQVIIDEFITSARAKWGQTPSLVMLLPHGLEGSGPDHASARLERFLQLAAETNMRVVNCTTAAQYFHLLRRQALLLNTDPLPLVIMTPKSLLRHQLVASPMNDLVEGGWQPVIDDTQPKDAVRRLLLCSGKIYVDLVSSNYRKLNPAAAIVRLEQLYPFPVDDLLPVIDSYPNLEEVYWVQEEPSNMGAWEFVAPLLNDALARRWPLHYVGRPRSSSPAEGSSSWHAVKQEAVLKRAFGQKVGRDTQTIILEK